MRICSTLHNLFSSVRRHSSTLSSLSQELKSRPLNITYDYLSPTPSHLLNVSLCAFLPSSCYPKYFVAGRNCSIPVNFSFETTRRPHPLHQGHHLVYFPPSIPGCGLLPDGTDTLHSPAAPTLFTRRLWAGGSLFFKPTSNLRLYLDGTRAACVEGIRDVTIKGKGASEKVFVHIERRYGHVNHSRQDWERHMIEEDVIRNIWEGNKAAIVENRDLVFLKAGESMKMKNLVDERVVKPSHSPDFKISLNPPPSLLFRFSALTFNAHAIHLDQIYSREVEGYRNLLVHGPLSLVLMLSVLKSQLREGELITSFTYRNLAPLYAQEEMSICLRKDKEDETRYEVWIEGKAKGYAVKGSATVGRLDLVQL